MSNIIHDSCPALTLNHDNLNIIDDVLDELGEVHQDLADILREILELSQQNKITFRQNSMEDLQTLAQAFPDHGHFTNFKALIEALVFVSAEKKPVDLSLIVATGRQA